MADLEEYDNLSDETVLSEILRKRTPVVLRNLDIGKAKELWNSKYLAEKIGDTPVKIHVCPIPQLDFLKKNFLYKCVSLRSDI